MLLVAWLTAWAGCADQGRDRQNEAVAAEAIRQTGDQFAPDRHLAIFHVTPLRQPDGVLALRGEVSAVEAKNELLQKMTQQGIKIVDRITVLPSEQLGDRQWGVVSISVANIRENPSPAAEMGTQLLMGEVVHIWKQQDSWYYVQAADGYIGWLEAGVFVRGTKREADAWNAAPRLIVTTYSDRVWEKPDPAAAFPVCDVVMGSLLQKVSENGDWFEVRLPDGRTGFLARTAAENYDGWRGSRQPTAENIERTARHYMGIPYLWGGTSTKGVDCSGFTKQVFQANGIQLQRNASQQARHGREVTLDPQFTNVRKGDLLFFGTKAANGKPARVVHVGIYLGDKLFIHSAGMVKLGSFDPASALYDRQRLSTLLSARRYLPE